MSVSKRYVCQPKNVKQVLTTYCADDKPTLEETARRVGTTYQNVVHIVNTHLPVNRRKAEKALRYSRSKMGPANPMQGKSGSLHHNHKGQIADGHGYLQEKVGGKYIFVHRRVMATALGLTELPRALDVHHIDGDKHNNTLDNLALVTPSGHQQLHAKRSKLERSPLWVQWVSGTSK